MPFETRSHFRPTLLLLCAPELRIRTLPPDTAGHKFCRADNERVAQNLARAAQTLAKFLIHFHYLSQHRRKDFGYDEDVDPTVMQNEVKKATLKWFEVVQKLLPPTTYTKNNAAVPYNFANTRSCRYFGDAMLALLFAGVKTNRENEDKGEQNQVTPKMLAQRFTMKGPQNARQVLKKAEESVRVGSQIPDVFEWGLRAAAAAELKHRAKINPGELRTKMQAVVAKTISQIMKEGTAPGFDVDTFVASNTFGSGDALAEEAEHMDNLEDNDDPDGQGGATDVGTDRDVAEAAREGGDVDIGTGDDDDDDDDDDDSGGGGGDGGGEEEEEEGQPQMRLQFSARERQQEEQQGDYGDDDDDTIVLDGSGGDDDDDSDGEDFYV